MKRVSIAVGFVLVACAGCHRNSLPPQANADEARAALITALEAWKNGETSDALAARRPPLYFNDQRCVPEIKLVSYKIEDGHEQYALSVRLRANLTMRLDTGETKERTVKYLVDTSPNMVIVAE